ncbi:transposase [Agrilactobacillus yilanensis]|uniref:Transposase n=1 Tax=Agrilactobacillus yilanensis TaxID=2485997 RepID=A0ABW4J412_9LACO
MPRSKHTASEKLAILEELVQSNNDLKAVANRHGIRYDTLERWRDRKNDARNISPELLGRGYLFNCQRC